MTLGPFPVGAYSAVDYSLESALGQLPLPLPFCSVRIQYSGAPASVQAQVTSVEARSNLIIDSHVQNEGNGWAGSGANPWHLDDGTESILFLTNEGAQTARMGFSVTANNTHYYLTDLQLGPHETRAIDLRKLRDAQMPDFKGSKIPPTASDGSVVWQRLDKLPVMGRLMVINRQQGMASNYDCCICVCPADYYGDNEINPATADLPIEGSQGLINNAQYYTCNLGDYYVNVTAASLWSSAYPNIASVNTAGTVKGQSAGTTGVTGQYNSYYYGWVLLHAPFDFGCEAYSTCGNGTNTTNVCSLSIASPSSNAVISLGGSSYNQATIPLEATSACSGTVNWTLSYTYTSRQPSTYTGSSSTTGTIGQTLNYTTPVGLGGEVTAQAQATLGGQNYTTSGTFYVLGTTIPNATITSRLLSLYSSGATPALLTGIAMVESTYEQFVEAYMMGGTGLWPDGSNSGTLDAYVGLMQVPNGMTSSGGPAFDWYTNTSTGASIFKSKLSSASSYSSSEQTTYPNLPALAGTQLENEALVYYGGFASGTHFYTPNSAGTAWVATTNTNVTTYVNTVLEDIQ